MLHIQVGLCRSAGFADLLQNFAEPPHRIACITSFSHFGRLPQHQFHASALRLVLRTCRACLLTLSSLVLVKSRVVYSRNMCSATGAGVDIACNENVPAPWPEDVAWGSSDGKPTMAVISRVHTLYNRWTYSYMNRIFRKGARQKKDASVQLAQEDLYRTPKEMEARKLGSEFWALFKHDGSFRRTLWKLAAPTEMR